MKIVLLSLLLLGSLPAFSQTVTYGEKNNKRAIREITLTGSGYKLGLQHGTLLKKKLQRLL